MGDLKLGSGVRMYPFRDTGNTKIAHQLASTGARAKIDANTLILNDLLKCIHAHFMDTRHASVRGRI